MRPRLWLPFITTWLVTASGAAQSPTRADVALGRDLARQGLEAAREGRWDDARASFVRAYSLDPRPATLFNLAGAHVRTGHLLDGARDYRRFIGEARDDAQRRAAESSLAEVERRIPRLRIRAPEIRFVDHVELDGREVERASLARPIEVDPGEHVVALVRGEQELTRETVDLPEGGVATVMLQVRETSAPRAALAADTQRESGDSVLESPWFWVVTGLLVAGGVTAAVLLTAEEPPEPYHGTFMPGHFAL